MAGRDLAAAESFMFRKWSRTVLDCTMLLDMPLVLLDMRLETDPKHEYAVTCMPFELQ